MKLLPILNIEIQGKVLQQHLLLLPEEQYSMDTTLYCNILIRLLCIKQTIYAILIHLLYLVLCYVMFYYREYSHDYYVKDAKQAIPRYVVRFKLPSNTSQPSSTSITTSTVQIALDEGQNASDASTFEFFDPVQYRPISSKEKLSNLQLSRRLITIDQAYTLAIAEASKTDNGLSGKVSNIDNKLGEVDEKLRGISLNYANIHDQILTYADQATKRLKLLSKSKLQSLLAIELELRRQKEEVMWAEAFMAAKVNDMSISKNNSTIIHFLSTWKCHAIFRNSLSRLYPVEVSLLEKIQADINIKNNIIIKDGPIIDEPSLGVGSNGSHTGISSSGIKKKNILDASSGKRGSAGGVGVAVAGEN